jgi:hypothetical protein
MRRGAFGKPHALFSEEGFLLEGGEMVIKVITVINRN